MIVKYGIGGIFTSLFLGRKQAITDGFRIASHFS
jgi:hypothetical protein